MTPPVPLPRGVYALPYLSASGHRQLVAVDRRGRFVSSALVFAHESEDDVGEMLVRLLDQRDSLPVS
jgi:hypothetical protein